MQCPDLLGVPCAGRGLCTLRDDVTCNAAFYSAELVPGEERVNPNQAQCKCNRGFRGRDCHIECYGGAGSECSGHGTCLDDGNCTCELGWVGLACNILCPGTSVDSPLPCNGHGSCTGVMLAGVNSSGQHARRQYIRRWSESPLIPSASPTSRPRCWLRGCPRLRSPLQTRRSSSRERVRGAKAAAGGAGL